MTSSKLRPWARTAFELLQHAEGHCRSSTDFDRRIALVGFDNAIELSIVTYLSLNPIQRAGRSYERGQVDQWTRNFHTKLEFLEKHALDIGVHMEVDRVEFIYYHSLRNDLYHAGSGFVPTVEDLAGIRKGAMWAFSILFECDAEALVQDRLQSASSSMEHEEPPLSDVTAFLQAFVSVKKAADDLIRLKGGEVISGNLSDVAHKLEFNDAVLWESIVKTLARADQAKDIIVQGEALDANRLQLNQLAADLGLLSARLNRELLDYQRDIVGAALEATLRAKNGNRRAGVVRQAMGTSLGLSLIAYLELCRANFILGDCPQIVLVDRAVLLDQVASMYRNFVNESDLREIVIGARDDDDIEQALHSDALLIMSAQMLRRSKVHFDKECIVAGYNLSFLSANWISDIFPAATSIVFTSRPFGFEEEDSVHEVGGVIKSYEFPEAVAQGNLLPVRVEFPDVRIDSRREAGVVGPTAVAISAEMLEIVARSIVDDVRKTKNWPKIKGFVLVQNIASAVRFEEIIRRMQADERRNSDCNVPASAIDVRAVTSELNHQSCSNLLSKFRDNLDEFNLMVASTAWLTGVDMSLVGKCYITCRLSPAAQAMVAGLVSRPHEGKVEGVIIDFARNNWEGLGIKEG